MHAPRLALITLFAGLFTCSPVLAAVLATQQLPTPLAPDMPSRLSIPMPSNLDPNAPVWVAYRMLALSADASPEGEIVVEGSFEGVPTPINATFANFSADDMTIATSAGTLQQQFESMHGKRSPEQMKALLGADLHAAYEAANAGTGRILDGTQIRTLPALGTNEGTLLVAVERASGIQPVGLFVTVGQGEVPASITASAGSLESSAAHRIGRILGMLLFVWLLYWFFVARRRG